MTQTIQEALANATIYPDPDTYRLIKLPPRAITAAAGVIAEIGEAFTVLIADKDEVTLVIPQEALDDFGKRLPGHEAGEAYRILTIDAVLSPDLIGFMAVVSRALAEADVGVFPYAAYSRDHIMVPAGQLERAQQALETLKNEIGD